VGAVSCSAIQSDLSVSIETGMVVTQTDKSNVFSAIVLDLILSSPVLWLFMKIAAEKMKRSEDYDEFEGFIQFRRHQNHVFEKIRGGNR
jgi:hypothetical protein